MSQSSIAQTRDGFSRIVNQLENGTLTEHYVMNRNRPVVKMVPVAQEQDVSKRIGAMKDAWDSFDYEVFQALDAEVARLMGI